MAREACPSCRRKVSTGASSCPGCGHPLEPGWDRAARRRRRTRTVLAAALVVPVAIAIAAVGPDGDDNGKAACGDEHSAFGMAQIFVEKRLRAPSSAEFSYAAANITPGPCGQWTIRSHVDAQNAFGAMIRTPFRIVIEKQGEKEWRLLSIEMADQG